MSYAIPVIEKYKTTAGLQSIRDLTIFFPGKLIFGKGKIAQLKEEIINLAAKKILIITINPLLSSLEPMLEEIRNSAIEIIIDVNIEQEPYFHDFENLMKRIGSFDPDVVVGIGGGSVLDMAKLVAAQLGNEQQLRDYVGIGLLKGRMKKLVCAPSTSGTGSEVSPNAILVDDADGQKKGIISPFLVPDIVIVKPLLTISVPPSITAATGIDALTHCLEAYTNKFAHPFIDLYAYKGMQLISANLEKAVQDGKDEEARTAVAIGSLYGGFCLGPVNTAAVHALSYPLGGMYHLPHGLSNALLLPHVMEFNLVTAPARYADVAIAIGCKKEKNEIATAQKGVEKIKELIKNCGLPLGLREVGVKENSFEQMASEAMKITRLLKNNPREIFEADAIRIYKNAF